MSTKQAALEYAARGWKVVPDHGLLPGGRCTCSDPVCNSPGKHPRIEREDPNAHVRREGTRDANLIKAWWERWPDSNLAIACGSSGLVIVDVDPRNNGLETLEDLIRKHGRAMETLTVQSGGGGLHLYFAHPGRGQVVRNRIGLYPGVDIKADGGRIVAPPSRHKSGGVYHWLNEGTRPAPLPAALLLHIQHEKGTGTWQVMRGHRLRF